MGNVLLLSLAAALNPTLVAATTVMLLLPHPGRLMLGYWLGAMITSITLGLLIVFSLNGSSTVSTTKKTLSPIADLTLATIFLALAAVLKIRRAKRLSTGRSQRDKNKKPPKWQQALRKGTARTTFLIGAALTLPGTFYLIGLDKIHKLHYSTAATVLSVVGFNLVMLLLLEGPLLAFALAPDWTPVAIERSKAWAGKHATEYAIRGLTVIGGALMIKGIIGLLS
jgi:hypothetical protein